MGATINARKRSNHGFYRSTGRTVNECHGYPSGAFGSDTLPPLILSGKLRDTERWRHIACDASPRDNLSGQSLPDHAPEQINGTCRST